MRPLHPRLALAATVTGALLIVIFAVTLMVSRDDLRQEIHQRIIDRDAAVLEVTSEAQLREAQLDPSNTTFSADMLLSAVLKQYDGMLAVAVYDAEGNTLQALPASLRPTELPADDFARLYAGEHISRYVPQFPLEHYFSDMQTAPEPVRHAPVLQVMLPLHANGSGQTIGFVQYLIDAHRLSAELASIDARVNRQTAETLAVGGALVALVLALAYRGLARAQRIIAERNERLTRANFELTLAAKTSALGVITSHLIHGLQGPVAGLRAMVAGRSADTAQPDWESAASYTDRMQAMIHETVALLEDAQTQTTYELTGFEIAASIRARNSAAASAKGVILVVNEGFPDLLDSHRGSLLCLIATNLVQNAIEATDPGRHVRVNLSKAGDHVAMIVADEGVGMPADIRAHLFEPGRSGRPGGTGLGLAISRLIARQIGATLDLFGTGASGTTFRVVMPLVAESSAS
ncbi:MAG TPA: sensor histidine kinase [Opitutaceae bacterium]|nr:sensor histidine kinase [Opitutaceae bacterium]